MVTSRLSLHGRLDGVYLLRWRGALRLFMDLSPVSVSTCCVIQEQRRMKKKKQYQKKNQTLGASVAERDTNHWDTQSPQRHVPELEFKGR